MSEEKDWLGECHAHIFMNGTDYRQAVQDHKNGPNEQKIRQALAAYQAHRVSFVRDGGDHFGASRLAKKLAPAYGITYLTPGFAIYKAGHYGKVVGLSFETMKEYRALIGRLAFEGGDFVKIMTTGILDFQTEDGLTGEALEKAEVREMVHIAHEEGFKVMSHTNGARAIEIAAEAGGDSLEHGNFQDENSIACMAAHQVIWVPTAVTIKNLIGSGRFSDKILDNIWQKLVENMRTARRLGVQFALGSDAGAYNVLHGRGIREEQQVFREIFPDDAALFQELKKGEAEIRTFVRET